MLLNKNNIIPIFSAYNSVCRIINTNDLSIEPRSYNIEPLSYLVVIAIDDHNLFERSIRRFNHHVFEHVSDFYLLLKNKKMEEYFKKISDYTFDDLSLIVYNNYIYVIKFFIWLCVYIDNYRCIKCYNELMLINVIRNNDDILEKYVCDTFIQEINDVYARNNYT